MREIFEGIYKTIERLITELELAKQNSKNEKEIIFLDNLRNKLNNLWMENECSSLPFEEILTTIQELTREEQSTDSEIMKYYTKYINNFYRYLTKARIFFVLNTINSKVNTGKTSPILDQITNISYIHDAQKEALVILENDKDVDYGLDDSDIFEQRKEAFFASEALEVFSNVTCLNYTEEYLKVIITLGQELLSNNCENNRDVIQLALTLLQTVAHQNIANENYYECLCHQIDKAIELLVSNGLETSPLVGHLQTLLAQLACEEEIQLSKTLRNNLPANNYKCSSMIGIITEMHNQVHIKVMQCNMLEQNIYQSGFNFSPSFEQIKAISLWNRAFEQQMLITALQKLIKQKEIATAVK